MYVAPVSFTFLALLGGLAWSGSSRAQDTQGLSPQIVDSLCRNCHRDKFDALAGNPHAVLDEDDWRERTGRTPGCNNCHRDAAEHIGAGGGTGNVFAFDDEPPAAQTAVCMGCHADSHTQFDRSAHAQAGLTCSDCHSQHSAQSPAALLRELPDMIELAGRIGPASRLCLDCHNDQLAAFELNERHRLAEGALECTSCHDPHASASRTLLGGFKQSQCAECHADKDGPFVYEHAASRVDGCTACHAPHGSPNRHMLAHQNVAEQCYSCHAAVPQFHFGFSPVAPPRFGLDTQCTNCHSAIHGSNFDVSFLK